MWRWRIWLTVLGLTTSIGCTAERLAYNHEALREEILFVYERQVMDNLVRAFNGDIALQLNYSGFSGKSTTKFKAYGEFGDSDNDNIGVVGTSDPSIIDLDQDGIELQGTAEVFSELAMKAEPVTKGAKVRLSALSRVLS